MPRMNAGLSHRGDSGVRKGESLTALSWFLRVFEADIKISDEGWKAVEQIEVVRCSRDLSGSGVKNSEASAVGEESDELE